MRNATRKQDWKIVNNSELNRLEKYLTLFFAFGPRFALVFSRSWLLSEGSTTMLCSRLHGLKQLHISCIEQGWAINLARGTHLEGRVQRRAVPSDAVFLNSVWFVTLGGIFAQHTTTFHLSIHNDIITIMITTRCISSKMQRITTTFLPQKCIL